MPDNAPAVFSIAIPEPHLWIATRQNARGIQLVFLVANIVFYDSIVVYCVKNDCQKNSSNRMSKKPSSAKASDPEQKDSGFLIANIVFWIVGIAILSVLLYVILFV